MLVYLPEKRASSKEMLKHPWLENKINESSSNGNNYKMSKTEHSKYMKNKKKLLRKISSDSMEDINIDESETEMYFGDDEDNFNKENIECNITDDSENNEDKIDDVDNNNIIHIQNFNNSFSKYGQHIKLNNCDKANPQFNKFTEKVKDIINDKI